MESYPDGFRQSDVPGSLDVVAEGEPEGRLGQARLVGRLTGSLRPVSAHALRIGRDDLSGLFPCDGHGFNHHPTRPEAVDPTHSGGPK